jgi:HD-GYP domain-containing protein (c-di-GMP phosphodiesterase class II)
MDRDIDSEDFNPQVDVLGTPKVERLDGHRSDHYDPQHKSLEVMRRERQVAYVDDLFAKLIEGAAAETEALSDVCRESIRAIVADKDLFLCLGLNPYDANYPARHSLHVATVAIAIGVVLGLDDEGLTDLGTGCLIHDVGMMKLDKRLYKSKRCLTPSELMKLAEHPVLTLDALASLGVGISRVARIVAYQIHERCDGSGYPRGRTNDEIHGLAKIAAVADAYIGLVSNRAHRRGMLPYFAIQKILESIPLGHFDPKAVRALLHAMSLFPVGSFVETSIGRIGRVVRSNGKAYLSPTIELWNEKHKQFDPDLVNLAEENSLRIVKASPVPKAA